MISTMSSRDAYMLVYSRYQQGANSVKQAPDQAVVQPPSRALECVQKLDLAHENACGEFLEKYTLYFSL
jgi:hypothetical protein